MENMIISTRRLILRPLKKADYKVWHKTHTTMLKPKNKWDKKARSQKASTPKKFKALLKKQSQQRAQKKIFNFGIFSKQTGELVGFAQVFNLHRGLVQSAMLGVAIYNRYWRLGYASELGKVFLKTTLKKFRLHRLEAEAEPDNIRSNRLIRSLGFRKEGLKKRAIFFRDQWRDVVYYAITCEDLKMKWAGKVTTKI